MSECKVHCNSPSILYSTAARTEVEEKRPAGLKPEVKVEVEEEERSEEVLVRRRNKLLQVGP